MMEGLTVRRKAMCKKSSSSSAKWDLSSHPVES